LVRKIFNVLYTKILSKANFEEDDSLNLDTLLIQLRGAVTSRWYQLGEALEVSKEVLDKCTNYPPEESIVEVLDQWLRNFPGRPTWRGVANALRRTGFQQLANDIEMVYETGIGTFMHLTNVGALSAAVSLSLYLSHCNLSP
jgi:hypothetical protein